MPKKNMVKKKGAKLIIKILLLKMREQGDSEIATANGPGIGAQNDKETNSKAQG